MTTYRVVVERDEDVWIADVPDVPGAHTQAGNLTKLDVNVRQVIALVLDLPDGAEPTLELQYEYVNVPAPVKVAAILGRRRAQAEEDLAVVQAQAAQSAADLVKQGWSLRDVGPLLGVSAGRISQIISAMKVVAPPTIRPEFDFDVVYPDGQTWLDDDEDDEGPDAHLRGA